MCTFAFMGDWRILSRGNTGAERILLLAVIPETVEWLSGVSGVGGRTGVWCFSDVGDPGSSLRYGRDDGVGWCCGRDDIVVVALRPR